MTSLSAIKTWYERGEAQGATHMIVAWDSFDGDYPIYVMPGDSPLDKRPSNGDSVVECYKYELGWDTQSKEYRAQHWD